MPLGMSHHPSRFARPARQYDHAARRHGVAFTILVDVVADLGSRRNYIGLVDDGVADAAISADLDPVHDDGIFDVAKAMDSHVAPDHTVTNVTAADNRAFGTDGVYRHPLPVFPVEDEFRRGAGVADSADRPPAMASIEGGMD